MKYIAFPVRKNGRDQVGTIGMIYGQYQSVQNFLRYNRKNFDDDKLYAVYYWTDQNERFCGFHSNLPFAEHQDRAIFALEVDPRSGR